jgi:hypothetical protein
VAAPVVPLGAKVVAAGEVTEKEVLGAVLMHKGMCACIVCDGPLCTITQESDAVVARCEEGHPNILSQVQELPPPVQVLVKKAFDTGKHSSGDATAFATIRATREPAGFPVTPLPALPPQASVPQRMSVGEVNLGHLQQLLEVAPQDTQLQLSIPLRALKPPPSHTAAMLVTVPAANNVSQVKLRQQTRDCMYVQFNGKLYAHERVNIDPGANCALTEDWWADVIGLPYTFPADGVNLLGVSGTTLAGVSSDVDIILGHGRSCPRDAPPLQGSDACTMTLHDSLYSWEDRLYFGQQCLAAHWGRVGSQQRRRWSDILLRA